MSKVEQVRASQRRVKLVHSIQDIGWAKTLRTFEGKDHREKPDTLMRILGMAIEKGQLDLT